MWRGRNMNAVLKQRKLWKMKKQWWSPQWWHRADGSFFNKVVDICSESLHKRFWNPKWGWDQICCFHQFPPSFLKPHLKNSELNLSNSLLPGWKRNGFQISKMQPLSLDFCLTLEKRSWRDYSPTRRCREQLEVEPQKHLTEIRAGGMHERHQCAQVDTISNR